MDEKEILNEVAVAIKDVLDDDSLSITMETSFVEDLDIMSIEIFQLVMILEEKYGIKMDENEISEFETVEDIVEYIKRLK